jgi:biopolymer transport protein ExbD
LQRREISPNINVTPLVDVCLVLLIIFMVVIPRMLEQIPVTLPGVFNPDPKVKYKQEPMKISITADGQYYMDDQQQQGIDALGNALALLHNENPERRLLINADASLEFVKIRPVLEKAQDLGFQGTGFMVGAKHRQEAEAVRGI